MPAHVTLKRTPFHPFHVAAGARLIDFAGYEMPVRFTGDVHEHEQVRRNVGLFDVSHMGEFLVTGRGALDFVQHMVTNDVAAIATGQALYTPMCRADAGIVDDLLVYRFADSFMLVVNSSNIAKDFAWLMEHAPKHDVKLEDRSDATALLALQGPRAPEVLRGHVPDAVLDLGYYRFAKAPLFGVPAVISRTGYTGEDGFELYFDPAHAVTVMEGLMKAGKPSGLEPIGLGARDTLRLEMAYMLYGNDIDDNSHPLEAGLGWTVKMKKGDFIGRDALVAHRERGLLRKLVGLEIEGRRVARHGMVVESAGRPVGIVTSGTFSPSQQKPIALAYVETSLAAPGTTLDVAAGTARLPAKVVATPFYTQGSRRA